MKTNEVIRMVIRGLISLTAKISGIGKPATEKQLRDKITRLELKLSDLKKQEWEIVKKGE